jgi:hypothetical protein
MAALGTDLQAKIEAYLLGRLPDDEHTRIEALLFEDDDAFEAIRDAEDDLIDRYVAGELTPADRHAFEHAFAVSTSRQDRIALARTLSQGPASAAAAPVAAASGTTAPGASAPAPVESPRRQPRRSFAVRRLALAAGATLAAVLVLTLAWRAQLRGTPSPSGPATGDAASGSGETMHGPSDSVAIATFSLPRIELRRGAGNLPRLPLPRGTTAIRLQPELEAPIPRAGYLVTLRRVEGQVVWQETARADVASDRFSVTVPARLVGPGDYVMSLATPGTPPEDSADYPFRIVAPD